MLPRLAPCHTNYRSLFHFEFEFIHPFADGNGRTGRLWHTLLLSRWRPVLAWVPIESIILAHQQEYYAAIAQSDAAGDSAAFVDLMLKIIKEAIEPYCAASLAGASRLQRTMELLEEDPTMNIGELAVRLGMSKRSAERLVAELKRQGKVARVGSPRAGRWVILG